MTITKVEVVAACAVKKFRKMVQEYDGSPAGLRAHLLKQLNKMNENADKLLADLVDEIL